MRSPNYSMSGTGMPSEMPMGLGAAGGQPMQSGGGQFDALMRALQANPAMLQQLLQQQQQSPMMGQPMPAGLGQ